MRKNQQRELERLERALMEAEDSDFQEWDSQASPANYTMYNTDDTDVELDDYSENVYRQDDRRGLSVAVTMVAMVALSACILLLLQILGVF